MRRSNWSLATSLLVAAITLIPTSEEDSHPFPSQTDWKFSSTGVAAEMSGRARAIVKKVLSVEQAEGVGARVRRSVGRPEVRTTPTFIIILLISLLLFATAEKSGSISHAG